jgi:hypothetical protein
MSNRGWIRGVIVLAGAALSVARAAEGPHINVKLGLWEVHTVPQVTGDYPAMADDQLAKMTPEMRARMQAAMQAAMADMNKPRNMKECMTAEKLQRGFNAGSQESSGCKTTVVTNSGTEFESKQMCTEPDGNRNSVLHITAKSSDHVVGTVQSQMSHNGRAMSFNATMEGRWLGADCGAVKDVEIEKIKP